MAYDIKIEHLVNTPNPEEIENIAVLSDYLTGQTVSRDVIQENVNEIVQNPSQILFVARHAIQIVGMSLTTLKTLPYERTAYGDSLIVHPSYRRQGIARQLLQAAIDYVDERGIIRQGATSPRRVEAWSLYQQLGYQQWDSRFIVRLPESKVE